MKKKPAPALTVTVLGRKIPVRLSKPVDDSFGEYQERPHEIRLDNNLDPTTYRRVLTHEMVHAALAISGIAGNLISLEVEEAICSVMESAIEDITTSLGKIK